MCVYAMVLGIDLCTSTVIEAARIAKEYAKKRSTVEYPKYSTSRADAEQNVKSINKLLDSFNIMLSQKDHFVGNLAFNTTNLHDPNVAWTLDVKKSTISSEEWYKFAKDNRFFYNGKSQTISFPDDRMIDVLAKINPDAIATATAAIAATKAAPVAAVASTSDEEDEATAIVDAAADIVALAAEKVADAAATKAVAKQVESDAKQVESDAKMAKEMQEEDESDAKQVESDAKMAKEMQKEDESKSGGAAAAVSTYAAAAAAAPATETKNMFDHMAMSAKANQAKHKSKKTPAKTLKDELKAVTSKIFALCKENKIPRFNKERQSLIDELKEKQEKLNKQIEATQVPCGRGECSNFVGYNHHGVLYTFCCHRCECMNTHGVTPGRLARINRTPPVMKTFDSVQKKHTTRAGLPRSKLLRDMKH